MLKKLAQNCQDGARGRIHYCTMKKIICLTVAAALCCGTLPALAACKTDDGRTDYKITAEYEDGTLKGVCAVSYYNASADTDAIEFNLYGNAYRQGATFRPVSAELNKNAYYAGESFGNMQISAVDGAKEWKVCGRDENILQVTLPHTLKSGARAEIEIEYELKLAKVNHRTGITQKTVNLGNFYPAACARDENGAFIECEYYSDGDPFISDCADYMVEITVPEGYEIAASGTRTETESGAYYSLENARDFCMVLSEEFTVLEAEADGIKVNCYYTDGDGQKMLDAAVQALTCFNETFGRYEYPQFSVVQTGFAAGGMEYPALAMVSDELSGDDMVYATVHETAHQWWYAMVGSDQLNCAWQDEGLTEYSTLYFFERHPEYGYTRTGIIRSATEAYRACYSVYGQLFGEADTTMNRHLKDFISDYEYVNIAYNKGLLLFDALRESLGDEKFFAALEDYFENYRGKIASYGEMCACFEKTGTDVSGLFESFVEGKIVI